MEKNQLTKLTEHFYLEEFTNSRIHEFTFHMRDI